MTTHKNSHIRQYVTYIGLAVIITTILNVVHSFFIGNVQGDKFDHNDYLLHIVPTIAGIFFGYLISRIVILNKELGRLASIDTLTGAYNRMQFDRFLEVEIDRARRYNNRFAIIFMDIDHFKKINDQHGHQTGDAVLNKFSDIIKETKRASDIFSRYGGEEFVMLAHIIDMEDARSCAERLRQRIEQHHFDKVEKLTCSFGITEYRKDDDSHAILKRADEALYKAKEAGRNCVIQA